MAEIVELVAKKTVARAVEVRKKNARMNRRITNNQRSLWPKIHNLWWVEWMGLFFLL